jgi:hypothetical protein
MSTLASPTRFPPLSFTLAQTTAAREYAGAVCHSPSSAVASCCDGCGNRPLLVRETNNGKSQAVAVKMIAKAGEQYDPDAPIVWDEPDRGKAEREQIWSRPGRG